MEDFILTEEKGFKIINLPKEIGTREFMFKYVDTDKDYILSMLKTTFAKHDGKYYSGNYYIKNDNNIEYFILISGDYIGLSTVAASEKGKEQKNLLYKCKDDTFLIEWNSNNKGESTGPSRIYTTGGKKYNKEQTFSKDELTGVIERLFHECSICENLDKLVNLNKLKENLLSKLDWSRS